MNRPVYILVIDDDPDDVDFLISAFKFRFPAARFAHCANGPEALEFLTKAAQTSDCPDLTFLDLHMPGRNGYDILVSLRSEETCGTMPIIVISTSSLDTEAKRCRDAGCTAFFSKPVSIQGYDEIVSKSLDFID